MSYRAKSCLFILAVIFGLAVAFYGFLLTESADPEVAVRKYVFLKNHPVDAVTIKVAQTGLFDDKLGDEYFVEGFTDKGREIKFFYLKLNPRGWYVNSAGKRP